MTMMAIMIPIVRILFLIVNVFVVNIPQGADADVIDDNDAVGDEDKFGNGEC